MGEKRKPPSRRTETVSSRLAPAEVALVDAYAVATAQTRSAAVRHLLVAGARAHLLTASPRS